MLSESVLPMIPSPETPLYVTKTALTGIQVFTTGRFTNDVDRYFNYVNGYLSVFVSEKHYTFDKAVALIRFEGMKKAKIKSLQRQLVKLEALEPKFTKMTP